MTNQEKKKYNQEHYRKNKSEILERVKAKQKPKNNSNLNVISLFKPKTNDGEKRDLSRKKIHRNFGTIYLQILVVAMTAFLVNEAAHFYASVDGTQLSGYFKAILLEGVVFAFTMLRARTTVSGVLYRIMILLIYIYSIWAISGSVVQSAFSQSKQVVNQEKIVMELEAEISKKTLLRDSFFQANRTTLASNIDQTVNALSQKLEQSREFLANSPGVSGIWNTLITLVLFRIFIMISNLFCLKELGRRSLKKFRTI